MTNAEIIASECGKRGITEEVHTFARWKQLGYKVKSGEHALFSTQLWKQCSRKKRQTVDEDADESSNVGCYLCKSYLFGQSQVEKMEDAE